MSPNLRWSHEVLREVLPNGLTLLVQPDPTSTVVAVVTHVRTGYFDEPDRWVGISHVLEHMYFKGTVRRGVGEIARETKRAGGYLNAGTIYDRTQYYTVLPAESLAQAIDIQSDALLHAAIDAAELEREIEVIVQEVKRKLDTPAAVSAETLYALLFDRHRMRRWRIGTEESLRRLTRDDVVRYRRTRYVPRRTIVAIAGGIDARRALALARAAYGAMPGYEPVDDPSPAEPEHTGFRVRWLRGDVRQAVTSMGWRTFGTLDPRSPALDLAAIVLAEGRGSWGFQHLRAPGVVSTLGGAHYTPTEVGVFQLGAETVPERVLEAVCGTWAVVRELSRRGPAATDLARAKALMDTGWARRFETADGRATALAEFEALGDYRLADTYFEQLMAVAPGDVQRAASGLSLDRAAVVGYLPEDSPTLPEGSDLEVLLARAAPLTRSGPPPPVPQRPKGPVTGRPRRVAEVTVLAAEGVDVLVARKSGVPLVTVGAVVVGPRQIETAPVAGSSLLTARAALRGAGSLDREALAGAAERLGGSLVTLLSPDWMGWRITVRPEALADAAQLLALVATEPVLADGDVETERELLEQDARRAADDMLRYPVQLALRAGFGDDAYGQPGLGTVESVRGLSASAVRRWYGEAVRRGRLVVGAVGDLEAEAAVEALMAVFSRWPSPAPDGVPPPGWRAGQVLSERREKRQTAQVLAFPAPARSAAGRRAFEILTSIASGFGGRLFEAVREKRSLAYSVTAMPWLRKRAGALLAYAATAPERAREARGVMLGELQRFAELPVGADELHEAQQHAVGMLRVRRQSGVSVLADLLEAHVAGAGVEELVTDEHDILAITADDVIEAAQAAFGVEPVVGMVEGAP